ncbi:Adiponectin receptor protein [Fragariocoptes setiger]|uniref:Adiponectin receptor protein n=1 Tax=Fragariocoptes setiger TaxID=1670756 RepID=A0ABQ7S9P5_9ACAR|nr:Adiponectin receptor protein [Fragariocoptes setiger]
MIFSAKLNHFTQQPHWLRDNHYLHHGHRPPTESFVSCVKSAFFMHNETLNIWTHFLPCFLFVFLFMKTLGAPNLSGTDKFVIGSFLTGAFLCHMFSTAFHTFSCHSEKVARFFQKLDHIGIALLITASFVPWLHYGFAYIEPLYAHSYLAAVVSLALLSIWFSLDDKFGTAAYRPVRALVFVLFGGSGGVPALHWLYIHQDIIWTHVNLKTSFLSLLLMGALYIFGAALYACRVPERFFPGKCDYVLHSHQLFHVLVTSAAIVHYIGISKLLEHVKSTYEANVDIQPLNSI